jgi:hypothetical protein
MVGLSIDQWIYRLAFEHSYGKQSFLAGFYRVEHHKSPRHGQFCMAMLSYRRV